MIMAGPRGAARAAAPVDAAAARLRARHRRLDDGHRRFTLAVGARHAADRLVLGRSPCSSRSLGLGRGLDARSSIRGAVVGRASLAARRRACRAGQIWLPYYRIDEYDAARAGVHADRRQRHPAPGDVAGRPAARPVVRAGLPLVPGSDLRQRPDRRRGVGHGRRRRARARAPAMSTRWRSTRDPADRAASSIPNHPYDDPRVTRINDDGRAFLRRRRDQYDLVVFALPDSLTLVSTSANLRLESFLFTSEAFARGPRPAGTRRRVRPLQLLSRGLAAGEDRRHAPGQLRQPADRPAPRRHGGDARGRPADRRGSMAAPPPGDAVDRLDLANAPAAATDDWPFLYLKDPFIAPYYSAWRSRSSSRSRCCSSFGAARRSGTSLRQFSPHFFVLGVAFLLLETQEPRHVQPALRFDVDRELAGVLRRAGERARRDRVNQRVRVQEPGLALRGPVRIDRAGDRRCRPRRSCSSRPWLRYVIAAALAFAPIFFANLVFSHSFRDTGRGHGLRLEPARSGRRWRRGVRRAGDRLPVAAVPRRRAVPARVGFGLGRPAPRRRRAQRAERAERPGCGALSQVEVPQ